jgi:hypothetical protein
VIGDGKTPQPHLASNPGLMLAPKDFTSAMLRPLAANEYDWHPQRSSSGPITIVISSANQALYVYRNGNPIGRAALEVNDICTISEFSHVYRQGSKGYSVTIYVREGDDWKIRIRGRVIDSFDPDHRLTS